MEINCLGGDTGVCNKCPTRDMKYSPGSSKKIKFINEIFSFTCNCVADTHALLPMVHMYTTKCGWWCERPIIHFFSEFQIQSFTCEHGYPGTHGTTVFCTENHSTQQTFFLGLRRDNLFNRRRYHCLRYFLFPRW